MIEPLLNLRCISLKEEAKLQDLSKYATNE